MKAIPISARKICTIQSERHGSLRETAFLVGYNHESMQKKWMEVGGLGTSPQEMF